VESDLLYRFFEGLATDDENRKVTEWVEASSQNRKQFFKERKLFDALILLYEDSCEFTDSDIPEREPTGNRKRIMPATFIKVAVVVTILLMSGLLCMQIKNTGEGFGMQTIDVPAGQYVTLSLPDGTQIWLNARTKIEYPVSFDKKRRMVKLDGQAYFEVAHNEKVPFIVETSKGNISVLGTKFDVMAYSGENEFVITLMDGKVKIDPTADPTRPLTLNPDTKAYLKDGRLDVSRIDDYDIYRWKEGLICFNNASFDDIMHDFGKIYGVKRNTQNKDVCKYTYTGKFRFVDGIDYALRVLQKDIKFSYEIDSENRTINIM
jgi:ferric-dicitrate binding protein FerR (iron transport regulator)